MINKNNISQVIKSSQIMSSQTQSYIHILETENGNKDYDHSTIVVVIIMINVVNCIDEKVKEI